MLKQTIEKLVANITQFNFINHLQNNFYLKTLNNMIAIKTIYIKNFLTKIKIIFNVTIIYIYINNNLLKFF